MPLALTVCGEGADPSPEAERRFFAKLRLPNGTWKTTYPNRLDDVNLRLLELLPPERDLELMDVAVSSGISTLEWSDQLLAAGVRHRLVAGDIDPAGQLVSWAGWLAALFDSSGREPLLLEVGPLTLPVRSARASARLARPLLVPLLRAIAAVARRAGARPRGLTYRPVPLVCAGLRHRAEIEIVRDDITVPGRFPQSFDAIRAANLVQPGYFDRATLRTIAANLRDRLREGGLLVICRTGADGVNRGTIFRRRGDRLSAEASLNGGSEVESLVLAL